MSAPASRVHRLAPGSPGGPLVVLAHGLEDTWRSWLPLAAHLDPDWRVVALDLPWRPGNDYGWRAQPPGWWLGDAIDLLDTLPDAVVAHSFGANATLELLCARDPRAGRAGALLCPFYRLPHRPVTWRMFDRSRATFVQQLRDGVRTRLGARAETMDPGVLETMMELTLARVGPDGFLSVFEQFAASAWLELGKVEQPTLVLAGDADQTLSREAALALAGAMPGGEARILPGYDHFCHVKHACEVAARITGLVGAALTPAGTTRTGRELR
jgi:pimeloyl-ACP methyl ester carboxylesterase